MYMYKQFRFRLVNQCHMSLLILHLSLVPWLRARARTQTQTHFQISIIEIPYHNKSEENPSALKMRYTNRSWENETMHKCVPNGLGKRERARLRQSWQSSTVVTWAQHLVQAAIQVFCFLSLSQSEHNTILGFVTQYLSLYCLSQKSMLFTWLCLRMCMCALCKLGVHTAHTITMHNLHTMCS